MMSNTREFVIDVEGLDELEAGSDDDLEYMNDPLGLLAGMESMLSEIDRRREELRKMEENFGSYTFEFAEDKLDIDKVVYFITSETTPAEFYNFITQGGTNCMICINGRGGRCNWPILLAACDCQNLELVALLLAADVSPNQCLRDGTRALDIAREANNEKLIQMLKAAGAIDGIPKYSPTIADYHQQVRDAVISNDVETCRKLLEEHAHEIYLPSIVIDFSHYCTRQAVMNGNFEMVRLLASHGDDFIESDHISNKSNIDIAREAGYTDIANYLIEKQRTFYQKLRDLSKAEQPRKTSVHCQFFSSSDKAELHDNADVAEMKRSASPGVNL